MRLAVGVAKSQCQSMILFPPLTTMYVCWCFRITGKIGSGHFGNVEKGIWKDSTNKAVVVAVKSLASEENKVKFLQEAVIMGQFSHPNIVNLYGVVTSGVPVSSSVLTCFLSCWSHANKYVLQTLSYLTGYVDT